MRLFNHILASCLLAESTNAENFLREKNHLSLYQHFENKFEQLNQHADDINNAITQFNACNYNSDIGTFYHINGIANKDESNTQQIQD